MIIFLNKKTLFDNFLIFEKIIKQDNIIFVMKKESVLDLFVPLTNYYKKIEAQVKTNPKKQFFFFILGFLFFYVIFTAIVYAFPKGFFESIVGQSVNFLLNLQGITTSTIIGEQFDIHLTTSGTIIIISWLCTGLLEIIILASTMLATFGVNLKEKILGIIGAIIVGFVFNLIRIMVTINIILTQNAQTFELAHDLLFRATLFLYIIIVYVIWFYLSIQKNKK